MTSTTARTTTLGVVFTDRAGIADAPTGRAFTGLAVPYNVDATDAGLAERFAAGAVPDGALVGLAIYYNHQRQALPVGRITAQRNRTEGAEIDVDLSDTTTGRDVAVLLRDGVLDKLSISFLPEEMRLEDDGSITHLKVAPKEVSIVGFPAYEAAGISEVRAATTPPTPTTAPTTEPQEHDTMTTTPELAERAASLEADRDDLARRLSLIESRAAGAGSTTPAIRFTSLGALVKGLADRSTTMDDLKAVQAAYHAAAEASDRAMTDGVLADTGTRPGWINRDIALVDKGRPLVNLFNREPLPKAGNSISYPELSATTDATGDQAAEGDALGLVTLKVATKTAPVATIGNHAVLSFQAIERSDVAYLNKVLQAQKIFYGRHSNKKVRDALVNITGAQTGADISATVAEGKAWTEAVTDAAGLIDTNSLGKSAEVFIMGLHHYKLMAAVTDTTGRPMFVTNGDGVNSIGNVNVRTLTGNVAGLPVVVDPTITGLNGFIVSTDAITSLEDGPWNLANEDIANLTKGFSLYGYQSVTTDDPKAVVKVKITAA
ncbi:HK97 family phage prohead protease [Propionibacteriaceae bacterium G57]|uniref:HK97 family phage prohead protease n=1 Tax=Aestuariimicrobium sp. G57 TaxID=3418485 RepID=UPI003DA79319